MPDYGGFDLRRPHALGALASVYEAGAGDGRPGRFAVKIFHPPPSTNVRRWYAIEGWLLTVERQRAVAQAGGPAVEILACGRCAEGAYAVMPWQEHAFESLAATLGAKGDLLRAVAERLLDALAEWEAHGGGPHGRLTPSNVFLSGSGELTGLSVRLSDPWFMPGAKPETLRARDLGAVGAILAQIVRRRTVGGWPIEPAPEWRALGRVGNAWLEYCNYLLNPQPVAGEHTLAEARRRLRRIPRDPHPVRRAVIFTGATAVFAAAGVTGFARFGNPKIMPYSMRRLAEITGNPRAFRKEVTPDWAKLCRAWGSWLGDLLRNSDRWERTSELWAPNDPLRADLVRFQKRAASLRPQALVSAAARESRFGVLAESPPEAVRQELLRGTVADRVTAAWRQVDALSQDLETWPRWEQLRQLLEVMDARHFTRAAAALRGRIPPLPAPGVPRADPAKLMKWFNDLSLDEGGTLTLANRWSDVTQVASVMEASADRVQRAMPGFFIGQLTDQPSLRDFAHSLAAPLKELKHLRAEYTDPAVVRERFLHESALQTQTGAVTEADIPRWEHELKLFSRVPAAQDPRLESAIEARIQRMITDASDLETEAPAGEAAGGPPLSRADFDRALANLRGKLAALRRGVIVRRDLPTVTSETQHLVGEFGLLERRLEGTLALLNPDVWLAQAAKPVSRLEAANQKWDAWRRAALAGVTAAILKRDRQRFRELRDQEHALRVWLEGLGGPDGFGGLAKPDWGTVTPATMDVLQKLETARRQQAAAAVVAAAKWRNNLPTVPWASVGTAVRAPLEAYRKWLAALPDFGHELDRLGQLLAGGYGWDEGVKEVVTSLEQREGVEALTGQPAEWFAEARRLADLAKSSDRAVLSAAARQGGLSLRLTAWRRLGAFGNWPDSLSELDTEGEIDAQLRGVVEREVKDEHRRNTLLAEITRKVAARWNRAARWAARNEADMSAVFSRMGRFGLVAADLTGAVAYNFRLWQLKGAVQTETNLGQLSRRREEFEAAVRGMPEVTGQPEVKAFLEHINQVDLSLQGVPPPRLSPQTVGWHEQLVDAGLQLIATWSGNGVKEKMTYILVQPDDNTPPFYLAKEAVSVGEFLDLVESRSAGQQVLAALPQWTRATTLDQPWDKPIAWRPTSNFAGLELNPTWFYLADAQVQALFDDSDLRRRTPALNLAATEKPTRLSPLQELPPGAARLFVEKLLGARLPRPQEWLAVARLLPANPKGIYRGQRFAELWRFLKAYRVGGQVVRWRPNDGAFRPLVVPPGGGLRAPFPDDGLARVESAGRLWPGPVNQGPTTDGFVNLTGNVWIYLYDGVTGQYYVAGGSVLAPPGLVFTKPYRVEASGRIGARKVTEGFSDVGIRPAFDAPPGIRKRFELLRLVRDQRYLTL